MDIPATLTGITDPITLQPGTYMVSVHIIAPFAYLDNIQLIVGSNITVIKGNALSKMITISSPTLIQLKASGSGHIYVDYVYSHLQAMRIK